VLSFIAVLFVNVLLVCDYSTIQASVDSPANQEGSTRVNLPDPVRSELY